jgi:hypothetical protein
MLALQSLCMPLSVQCSVPHCATPSPTLAVLLFSWLLPFSCPPAGSQGGGYFIVSPDARSVKEYAPWATLSPHNKKTLNPHGIDVDEDNDIALTSDFVDVSSTIITAMNQAPTPM